MMGRHARKNPPLGCMGAATVVLCVCSAVLGVAAGDDATAASQDVCVELAATLDALHSGGSASPLVKPHFLRHGGHKSVYQSRWRGSAVVLKAPLQQQMRVDPTGSRSGAGGASPLSQATGIQMTEAQRGALYQHMRKLFHTARPGSPLLAVDVNKDGEVSDEELDALAASSAMAQAQDRPTGSSSDGDVEDDAPGSDWNVEREQVWFDRLTALADAGVDAAQLVPVVHGVCGNTSVVEFLKPLLVAGVTSRDWTERARRVLGILTYLRDLGEVPHIGPLYACDMHLDNFGAGADGRPKLLDVDCLYSHAEIDTRTGHEKGSGRRLAGHSNPNSDDGRAARILDARRRKRSPLPSPRGARRTGHRGRGKARGRRCVDDWQCDVKSSCPGSCVDGRCQQFPAGVGVNMHHFCRLSLNELEDDPTVLLGMQPGNVLRSPPVGATDPARAQLSRLFADCTSPSFASTARGDVHKWLADFDTAIQAVANHDEL